MKSHLLNKGLVSGENISLFESLISGTEQGEPTYKTIQYFNYHDDCLYVNPDRSNKRLNYIS